MFQVVCYVTTCLFVLGHAAPNIRTIKSADEVEGDPVVTIPQGTLLGKHKKSYDGKPYLSFEGIPFAKPPLGDLRFEEPQPAEKWNDILVADQNYMCLTLITVPIMHGVAGTEDCLYINIYVPGEKLDPEQHFDVVVHIHGGAFSMGSPQLAAGPDFIMNENVVYVTFNYRLGLLGFLSTEDGVVPGNNGLKDQSLALKWINENIKHFSGNPDSVTITGLSAGAASVHYHYLSPLSKGLFHKGFSQSGTALHCWALVENPLKTAQIIAKNISCPTDSTEQMVECFKGKEGHDLMLGINSIFLYYESVPFVPWGPVIEKGGDNPFISEHPYKLMERGEIYDVPWITSNTLHEGIIPTGFFALLNKMKDINENWTELMYYTLDLHNTVDIENKQEVTEKVREFYFNNEPVTLDNVYKLVQVYTHRLYTIDSEKAVRLQAKTTKSPVYFYLFGYFLQMPFLFDGIIKPGVSHGDDGRLVFVVIGTPSKLQADDEKMMRLFTDFIANFAKTGVPSFDGKEWLKVDPQSEDIDYLYIGGPENIAMNHTKEFGPHDFWSNLPIKELDNYVT